MRVWSLLAVSFLTLYANDTINPYADGFQYQGSYQEQSNPGSSLITFGLGHLFNYDRVIAEYQSYFRPDTPHSSKYKYKFDYADSISKQ